MKPILATALILAATLTLGACSMRPDVSVYQAEGPKLELQTFFAGKTTAHGLVKDWRGKVIRRFYATIDGTFDKDGKGTLAEVFYWNDGEVQTRTWQVWRTGEGTFAGTAGDVVGQATGKASGNALNWRYMLAVNLGTPEKPNTINLHLDDWMYLLPDNTLLNITDMRKFGLKVGEIVIFIQPANKAK
jgi:hypothetical protein